MKQFFDYDVIVVGGGHAGVEAALVSSRLGKNTLIISNNASRLGYMSCNPSIGGLAKGHMVRELDVLGGEMGKAADFSCIQYKRLNASRGPAVRGTRMQTDKQVYSDYITHRIHHQPNLTFKEGEVNQLTIVNSQCHGVVLKDGSSIKSQVVIITTGTFMNAVMHTGFTQEAGGRIGDQATYGISDQLRAFGFDVRRLKTGTPARLHRDSIDWTRLEPQWGDDYFYPFSFTSPKKPLLQQVACHLSRTSEKTHQIIRDNLHLSPMFSGIIEGVGPRYCPSIEDKVTRFIDKTSHQTFLEPEGLNTPSIYLQGISTSLPKETQDQFLKTITGLEQVKVLRYGYAVEYDFIIPTQIHHRLETRPIENLFLAGQINGSSGYEEAAVQGLMAGINAVFKIDNKPEFVLGRDQAYIGVLIDDLVTKGTLEPYRMLTSRAEHRLVLREDNTLDRLANIATHHSLMSGDDLNRLNGIVFQRNEMKKQLTSLRLTPKAGTQELLIKKGSTPLNKSISFDELLRRPEINVFDLKDFGFDYNFDPEVGESVEIDTKYSGYIKKQMDLIEKTNKMESAQLPIDLNYQDIKGLSAEEVEKLLKVKPRTLGQAQRISGVNPSAIQSILVYLKSKQSYRGQSWMDQYNGEFPNGTPI